MHYYHCIWICITITVSITIIMITTIIIIIIIRTKWTSLLLRTCSDGSLKQFYYATFGSVGSFQSCLNSANIPSNTNCPISLNAGGTTGCWTCWFVIGWEFGWEWGSLNGLAWKLTTGEVFVTFPPSLEKLKEAWHNSCHTLGPVSTGLPPNPSRATWWLWPCVPCCLPVK